jgi:hypothetical protein
LGIVVLAVQFLAIMLMWLNNDLAGVDGEGASVPWVDGLRTVLLAALLAQAIALGANVRSASSRAWIIWIGLWATCLAGVWIAFAGPLDALDTPILLTAMTLPIMLWQVLIGRPPMRRIADGG